jgi:hypothetical protein
MQNTKIISNYMIDLREVKHAEQRGCNVYVGERPQIQVNEAQRHVLDMGRRQLLHGAAHCQNLQPQSHSLLIFSAYLYAWESLNKETQHCGADLRARFGRAACAPAHRDP